MGAVTGAAWGLYTSAYLNLLLVAFLSMLGAIPGLVGGLLMGLAAPRVSTKSGRMATASLLGAAIGFVYGLTPLLSGYVLFTAPSGAVGGLLTAIIVCRQESESEGQT